MNIRSTTSAFLLSFLCILAESTISNAATSTPPRETIAPAFQEALAGVPGKVMTALVVSYPPGGKSLPHRHGKAFVVAYVLSGSIRSQIEGGKSRVYNAGEHWTEAPGVHHKLSENASATKPAKLLAIFVADTTQHSLVTWDRFKNK